MSSKAKDSDTFHVAKEAKQAAHEVLHKREAQGLERNVEGIAREFGAEDMNKKSESVGKEQPNEVEDLITL